MTTLAFELTRALEASEPPEARGLARDEVRLMVATRASEEIVHSRFRALPNYLRPGDLLVINNSATLPAAVPASRGDGSAIEVRFSTRAPQRTTDLFIVELRNAGGNRQPKQVAAASCSGLRAACGSSSWPHTRRATGCGSRMRAPASPCTHISPVMDVRSVTTTWQRAGR